MITKSLIKGKKITLKILNLKNYNKEYYKWLNDKEINKFLEVRFKRQNKKSTENYILNSIKNPNCLLFGIFFKKNNVHIGNIKLEPINFEHKRGIVGLFIGKKEYWGKGLASDSIRLISKYVKKELSLKKLVAGCYSNNIASKKAFLNAGYKVEAILKDYWYDERQKKFINEIILTKNI